MFFLWSCVLYLLQVIADNVNNIVSCKITVLSTVIFQKYHKH